MKNICLVPFATAAVVLATTAFAAPDFATVVRETGRDLEAKAKAERTANAEKEKAFIMGLREGGSTYGYGQMPMNISEPPRASEALFKEARDKIRAALPEGELGEDDQIRYDAALLELEQKAGDRASRKAAVEKLKPKKTSLAAVNAVFSCLNAQRKWKDILAFADEVAAANPTNTDLKAAAYSFRLTAAYRIGDQKMADETVAALDALPATRDVYDAYVNHLWRGQTMWAKLDAQFPKDMKRVFDEFEAIRQKQNFLRGVMQAASWAGNIAHMEQYLALFAEKFPSQLNWARGTLVAELMKQRCYAKALPVAGELFAAEPTDGNALLLARVQMALGLRGDAAKTIHQAFTNEAATMQTRITAGVIEAVAKAKTTEDATRGVLALAGMVADGKDFATFVNEAEWSLFEPLMTDENAKWLIAVRNAFFELQYPEERVVHTVRYLPSAPCTAEGAELMGLFSMLPSENRFAPYKMYSWSDKRSAMNNLKCGPKPELAAVKGDGRSAEILAVYDDTGVHIYSRFRDPAARKFKLGEAGGAYYEFTFMPGTETGYYQVFRSSGSAKDLNEVEWDSVDFGHRQAYGNIFTDTATRNDCFLFHTFIPWTFAYSRIPKNGDTWGTVLCVGLPSGTFVLGGGQVHELGRGMKLKFDIPAAQEKMIRKAVVRRAAGDFLRLRAQWEVSDMWEDQILGDPDFFRDVLEPWLKEIDADALKAVKGDEISDADAERFFKTRLVDWADFRLSLDKKRGEYLEKKFFTEK